MTEFLHEAATVLLGIIFVAAVAVIVSKNSQSPAVIQAGASGFNNALDVAVSPVTGATTAPVLAYPSTSYG
jgi:hypothetical protein